MGTLIFPVFAFGCIITGIVFLGVIQARDFAKSSQVIPANNSEAVEGSNNGQMVAAVPGLAAAQGRSGTIKR
ncbi:MAG TPA: hypothetical protein VKY92_22860 [Verrucomicrobiae bacterium]|nr:hypothetical protein [Verrucomicrobiae bacterium]